jgi:hypothetical protein
MIALYLYLVTGAISGTATCLVRHTWNRMTRRSA